MGWWTTITEKAQTVKDTATKNIKWFWDWTYTPLATATDFATATFTSGLEQSIALKKSIPALASPESAKIVKAIIYLILYHIIPLLLLNAANNYLQAILRANYSDEEANTIWCNDFIIPTSTLINWGVWAYTTHRSAHMFAQTLVVDITGAAAFNAAKPKNKILSPCEQEGCNFKRRIKGSLREPLKLFSYDLITGAISYIPWYGSSMALFLKIGFSGDIIARAATIERCERHRTTDPATIWSLGLVYTLAEMLMNRGLASTVGVPPYLVHRTMQHILLLFFINNATHMKIDYVPPGQGSLSIDPITAFNVASGTLVDVMITGSKEEISRLLQFKLDREPIISMSTILKKLTDALNSDLEKINQHQPGFFKVMAKKSIPPIYHSATAAINDPVIRIFWPDIQELARDIIHTVNTAEKTVTRVNPLLTSPVKKALSTLLYQYYGIPPNVTGFLINLCKDEDFWNVILALKQWLERHDLSKKPPLALATKKQLDSLHEKEAGQPSEPQTKRSLTAVSLVKHTKRPLNPLLFVSNTKHEKGPHQPSELQTKRPLTAVSLIKQTKYPLNPLLFISNTHSGNTPQHSDPSPIKNEHPHATGPIIVQEDYFSNKLTP